MEANLKKDNVFRRGLKTMYGGTDLINKIERGSGEEELEREEWMNKPEQDMNEEEKIKYQEFLQKLATHEENKRRKWDSGLTKRRKEILEIKSEFEESLLELVKKRLFFDARIYEQELYIVRMIIMLHEKRETHIDKIKFRNERETMMEKLEDKQTNLLNCEDYTTEFEQTIRNDTSIAQHEQIVRGIAPPTFRIKSSLLTCLSATSASSSRRPRTLTTSVSTRSRTTSTISGLTTTSFRMSSTCWTPSATRSKIAQPNSDSTLKSSCISSRVKSKYLNSPSPPITRMPS